jgi:hypothetical protein
MIVIVMKIYIVILSFVEEACQAIVQLLVRTQLYLIPVLVHSQLFINVFNYLYH